MVQIKLLVSKSFTRKLIGVKGASNAIKRCFCIPTTSESKPFKQIRLQQEEFKCPTIVPAFIEWQSTICRSLPAYQNIFGKKVKPATKVTLRGSCRQELVVMINFSSVFSLVFANLRNYIWVFHTYLNAKQWLQTDCWNAAISAQLLLDHYTFTLFHWPQPPLF